MYENEEMYITFETIRNSNINTTSVNTALMISAKKAVKAKYGRIFKFNIKIMAIFA